MPRRCSAALVVALAAVLVAGCGGSGRDRSAPPTHARGPAPSTPTHARGPAPMLVSFKRWAGSDPAEDDIVVRRDRTADLHLIHGGAGGRFRTVRLSASEWSRLRAALARDPLAHPGRRGRRAIRGAYRYVVFGDGRAVAGDEGRLPVRVARVVSVLNRVIEDHGF